MRHFFVKNKWSDGRTSCFLELGDLYSKSSIIMDFLQIKWKRSNTGEFLDLAPVQSEPISVQSQPSSNCVSSRFPPALVAAVSIPYILSILTKGDGDCDIMIELNLTRSRTEPDWYSCSEGKIKLEARDIRTNEWWQFERALSVFLSDIRLKLGSKENFKISHWNVHYITPLQSYSNDILLQLKRTCKSSIIPMTSCLKTFT